MMKLLVAGLALIAAGLALVLFTDLNPAMLLIAGVVCAFIAVIRGAAPFPDRGPVVPAGALSDAESLSNVANYGSAAGDARCGPDANA
jgi:hypothetical protein